MSNPYQYQYPGQPLLPISSQETSQDPKLRWKILLLACFSTFGANFASTFLTLTLNIILQTLKTDWNQYNDVMSYVSGWICLVPLLAGFLIYRFGINRSFCWFACLLTLGSIVTSMSLKLLSWSIFVIGQIIFQTANSSLILTQLSMIIKWFKTKEICFAIAAIAWLNLLASRLGYFLANQINPVWLGLVLDLGSIFCILSIICVIYINKIDVETSQTEEEKTLIEEIRSIRPAIWTLLAAIVLFSVGDFTARVVYVFDLLVRFPFKKPGTVVDNLWLYVSLVAFPLFGYLLDKLKGKRIIAILCAIVVFFIGNLVFFALDDSENAILIYVIYFFMVFGSCLFFIPSWACLGLGTPLRVLGVVLGVAYTLITCVNRIEQQVVSENQGSDKSFYWAAIITLAAGVILVGLTWKLDRKNGGRIEAINGQDEGQRREFNRPVNY